MHDLSAQTLDTMNCILEDKRWTLQGCERSRAERNSTGKLPISSPSRFSTRHRRLRDHEP